MVKRYPEPCCKRDLREDMRNHFNQQFYARRQECKMIFICTACLLSACIDIEKYDKEVLNYYAQLKLKTERGDYLEIGALNYKPHESGIGCMADYCHYKEVVLKQYPVSYI